MAHTMTSAAALTESATDSTGAEGEAWSFSASVFVYLVPDDRDYLQPTFVATRGRLQLVVRYNYEDFNTGSAWIGWNFNLGDELALELAPMAGLVFGGTNGIAPGYMGSLSWRKLELYSESELVFDTENSFDDFFYNWSELTLAPTAWFRFGGVIQKTKGYESDREIQRGVLAGLSYRRMDVSTYVFNPDDDRPVVVLALGWRF
jgi:hypothetical protein